MFYKVDRIKNQETKNLHYIVYDIYITALLSSVFQSNFCPLFIVYVIILLYTLIITNGRPNKLVIKKFNFAKIQ